jgi:hypothetical protein
LSADEVRIVGLGGLRGRGVVVTKKLDGENTTLYADGLHTRSPALPGHVHRTWYLGATGTVEDVAGALYEHDEEER